MVPCRGTPDECTQLNWPSREYSRDGQLNAKRAASRYWKAREYSHGAPRFFIGMQQVFQPQETVSTRGVLTYSADFAALLCERVEGGAELGAQFQSDGITCRALRDDFENSGTAPQNRTSASKNSEAETLVRAPGIAGLLRGEAACVPSVLLCDVKALHDEARSERVAAFVQRMNAEGAPYTCVLVGEDALPEFEALLRKHHLLGADRVFMAVPSLVQPDQFHHIVQRALAHCELQFKAVVMERELHVYADHLQELNRIGIALSAERDLDTLLTLILSKSREITGADASSLYLVEADPDSTEGEKYRLRFKLSQNDSVTFNVDQPMEISHASLAGHVALTGEMLQFADVYDLPQEVPYSFNRSFDEANGYRTKSMLVIPMRNHKGETIGVLQLINRKTHPSARLENAAAVEREVIAFSQQDQEMAGSLASQAAVAIENSHLYQSIELLFEGFVAASARAVEQRDPTTSGHSERVAILTLGVAEMVSKIERGVFADVKFSAAQIKELRYAALLHDFGKVGVREDVLLKSNKLYPYEYELLRQRFDLVKTLRERDFSDRKIKALLEETREIALSHFPRWDAEFALEMGELDEFFRIVSHANNPLIQWMNDEQYALQQAAMHKMRDFSFDDRDAQSHPLISDHEMRALSIRRGSLGEEERHEIERHVTHTYDFLRQIPWTKEYGAVPHIALCHHEKCDGGGYPLGLTAPQIPIQAKMMTVVDIYDALTASDRPYKKACTTDRALDILQEEARDGHIDADLLEVFTTNNLWKLTQDWKKRV